MFQLFATLKQLSKWTDEVTAGDKCNVQHQLLIYQTYDDMLALHAEDSDLTYIISLSYMSEQFVTRQNTLECFVLSKFNMSSIRLEGVLTSQNPGRNELPL